MSPDRTHFRKRIADAAVIWFLVVLTIATARGQTVRGPDLGVWFRYERAANGSNSLVVADLIPNGVLAQAGLHEGDRIGSINGRSIDREPKFVDAFLTAGNREVILVVERSGRQQTLTIKTTALMSAMVPADPLYQAGLLLEEESSGQVVVTRVFNLTPAFYAGLKPGDVVTTISGQPIQSVAELTKVLRWGGNLTIIVNRNGQTRQLTMLIWNDRSSRRRSLTGGSLTPGANQPPPLTRPVPPVPSAPLLAPPAINPPALSGPPPAIPALRPPGTVSNGPR